MDHEKHVREGSTKVSAVDGAVSRGFGRVDVFAARAVELDGFLVGDIGEADRKEGLTIAEDARAPTKVGLLVFVDHFGQTTRGDDEAGVDETVEMSSGAFDAITHLLVDVFLCASPMSCSKAR